MKNWEERAVLETDRGLPTLAEADVIVCGGGPAGVATAVTAARSGMKTVMIEKYGFCGGASVAGLSGTICGMYTAAGDREKTPEQVVFGFAEEFRQGLLARKGATEPQPYGKTRVITFDPMVWRETADDMLLAAGVKVLFHTLITGVLMQGDGIRGVRVDSSAGQSLVKGKIVVDATGDGSVSARMGCAYRYGDQGRIQNPTMIFRVGGIDMDRYLAYYGENDTICPEKMTRAISEQNGNGAYSLPRNHIWMFPLPAPGMLLVNATRLAGQDGHMLNPVNPEDRTEAEILGRKAVREYERFFRDFVPGCENIFLVDTGVEVGVRQTRSILGVATLTNDDVVSCRKRPDGVVRSPWPIELHSGEKPKLHWLLDDYYEIPFGALIPEKHEGIILAGRCLSAEHEALASGRVTAQCFEMGHAVGVASTLAVRSGRKLRDIPGEEVRTKMAAQGSRL